MVQGGWLAEKLAPPRNQTHFLPVDKVVLGYYAIAVLVIFACWRNLPGAAWLLAGHVVLAAFLVFEIRVPNPTSWFFRNWYPCIYVTLCYREMALFIAAIRHSDADRWLDSLDFKFWGVHPTLWL